MRTSGLGSLAQIPFISICSLLSFSPSPLTEKTSFGKERVVTGKIFNTSFQCMTLARGKEIEKGVRQASLCNFTVEKLR